MNSDIKTLLEKQEAERKAFCKFSSNPENIEVAIPHLIHRFQGINESQIIILLKPWFPQYVVSKEIESLVFWGKLPLNIFET